jgi:hypothetical protein
MESLLQTDDTPQNITSDHERKGKVVRESISSRLASKKIDDWK